MWPEDLAVEGGGGGGEDEVAGELAEEDGLGRAAEDVGEVVRVQGLRVGGSAADEALRRCLRRTSPGSVGGRRHSHAHPPRLIHVWNFGKEREG